MKASALAVVWVNPHRVRSCGASLSMPARRRSGRATMWCERGASGPVACVFLNATQPVTRDGEFV